MKRIFLLIITTICMVSCAGLTHVTVPQSNINYEGVDIVTSRKVSYTLQKTYVLGIGGLSERARNTNIIDNLMKKANLKTNETLGYITISRNINCYVGALVIVVKYTATGYVVRPINTESVDHSSSNQSATTEDTPISIAEEKKYNDYNELKTAINRTQSLDSIKNIKSIVEEKYKDQVLTDKEYKKLLEKINIQTYYLNYKEQALNN